MTTAKKGVRRHKGVFMFSILKLGTTFCLVPFLPLKNFLSPLLSIAFALKVRS